MTPLLTGSLADAAWAALERIAGVLRADPERWLPGASLASGASGGALFFAYLGRATGRHEDVALAHGLLERAQEQLGGELLAPGLLSGFCGVAWVTEHLATVNKQRVEEDPAADLDRLLVAGLRSEATALLEHDLVGGLAGIAVCALERARWATARTLLAALVERLHRRLEPQPVGAAWRTAPQELAEAQQRAAPEGWLDVGMAHGAAGVVATLARAVSSGVSPERAALQIRAAVSWLLSLERGAPGERFPRSVPAMPGSERRSGWCYGDPGVALALLHAGRALREPSWEALARSLADETAGRDPEETGVRDAGLCHGVAGVGHLLHRFARAWNDERLAAAARVWLERALALDPFERRQRSLVEGEAEVHIRDGGLLTGAAGVGLALLGGLSPSDPGWDRVLGCP